MKRLYLLPLVMALAACAEGSILEHDENLERPPLVIPAQTSESVEVKIEPKAEAAEAQSEQPKTEAEVVVEKTVVEQKTVVAQKRPDYVPYVTKPYKDTTPQQIYSVLASRAVNRMLKDTASQYADNKLPQLYVDEPKTEGSNVVPENYAYTATVVKDIITGSHSYLLTDSQRGADYVLESYVSSNRVPGRETEIVVYKLIMKDADDKQIGAWHEALSPVTNDDQSWW